MDSDEDESSAETIVSEFQYIIHLIDEAMVRVDTLHHHFGMPNDEESWSDFWSVVEIKIAAATTSPPPPSPPVNIYNDLDDNNECDNENNDKSDDTSIVPNGNNDNNKDNNHSNSFINEMKQWRHEEFGCNFLGFICQNKPPLSLVKKIIELYPEAVTTTKENMYRPYPLSDALQCNAPLDVIQCLIEADLTDGKKTLNYEGNSYLEDAISKDNLDVVKLLLKQDRTLLDRTDCPLENCSGSHIMRDSNIAPMTKYLLREMYRMVKENESMNKNTRSTSGMSGKNIEAQERTDNEDSFDPNVLLEATLLFCQEFSANGDADHIAIDIINILQRDNPNLLRKQNQQNGYYPLHTLLSYPYESESEVTRYLLEVGDPDVVKIPDIHGNYPLHIAIKSGRGWESPIEQIFHAYPEAATKPEKVTGLYPFMIAAVAATKAEAKENAAAAALSGARSKNDATSEAEDDDSDIDALFFRHRGGSMPCISSSGNCLNTCYELLRKFPDLIKLGLPPSPSRKRKVLE